MRQRERKRGVAEAEWIQKHSKKDKHADKDLKLMGRLEKNKERERSND